MAVQADLAKLTAEDKTTSNCYAMMQRYRQTLARYKAQQKEPILTMDLHVVRLGDVAFATNRFEYFLDFGIRIKARSPAVQTFLIQLAGDTQACATYLPTERALAGKGYGGGIHDNEAGPEGGQELVEKTLETINSLWA